MPPGRIYYSNLPGRIQLRPTGFVLPGRVQPSGDLTAPTVTGWTVAASGDSVTVNFSEAVTGGTGMTVTLGTSNALTYSSGSGTSALVFSTAWTIGQSTAPTLGYSGGDIVDLAGNALASFSGTAVTSNDSTTWTPQTLGTALKLWLPANGTYEVTAGGGGGNAAAGAATGRWVDRSGNGNHGDAPSSGARPTRAGDGRGVVGNATDQTMLTAGGVVAYGSNGFTYFWKWKRASASANSEAALGYAAANDSRWGGFGGGGQGGFYGGSSVKVVTPADTNENVVGLTCNISAQLTVNKYDGSTEATGNVHFTASAVGLGILSRNNTGLFSGDTVIEIVTFNRQLTGGETTSVRTYLAGV